MHYVWLVQILIWNFHEMKTQPPQSVLVPDYFPTYPSYLHAQVRTHLSTEYLQTPPPDGRSQDQFLAGNQELIEEKGYIDKADNTALPVQHQMTMKLENGRSSTEPLHGTQLEGPSKILKFAATNLYDADAHQRGIYKARNSVTGCGQIETNVQDDSRVNAKFRQQLAKNYMDCIKTLYFGNEPLSSQIFNAPAVSKHQLIKMESMDTFLNDFRKKFN